MTTEQQDWFDFDDRQRSEPPELLYVILGGFVLLTLLCIMVLMIAGTVYAIMSMFS